MTDELPSYLLLFVSGEPGPEEDSPMYRSFSAGLASFFVPPILFLGTTPLGALLSSPRPSGRPGNSEPESTQSRRSVPALEDAWHISRGTIPSVALVLDVAKSKGWGVTIVNANASGRARELVDRWLAPEDLLPVLVRPDGERLVGLEMFTPRNVRRFLTGSQTNARQR